MRISGTDLYIPQNDTTKLELIFNDSFEKYDFYMFVGDKQIFKSEDSFEDEEGENKYKRIFEINSNHTQNPGRYYYDIIMVNKVGDKKIKTIINKALFVIEPSINEVSSFDPDTGGENPEPALEENLEVEP